MKIRLALLGFPKWLEPAWRPMLVRKRLGQEDGLPLVVKRGARWEQELVGRQRFEKA